MVVEKDPLLSLAIVLYMKLLRFLHKYFVGDCDFGCCGGLSQFGPACCEDYCGIVQNFLVL